jgi:hypothetical protein
MTNKKRLIKAYQDAQSVLENILPHGSGIDYDWSFEVKGDTIIANNGWHYMNGNGMYVGGMGFDIVLKSDGSYSDPDFHLDDLVKSEVGKEVAYEHFVEDDENENPQDLSEEEIRGALEWETDLISDVIFGMFETVNKEALAKAVKDYIAEEQA